MTSHPFVTVQLPIIAASLWDVNARSSGGATPAIQSIRLDATRGNWETLESRWAVAWQHGWTWSPCPPNRDGWSGVKQRTRQAGPSARWTWQAAPSNSRG